MPSQIGASQLKNDFSYDTATEDTIADLEIRVAFLMDQLGVLKEKVAQITNLLNLINA